jgi:hypothetical protein
MAKIEINTRNVFNDEGVHSFIALGDPQKLFGAGGLISGFKKKILGQDKTQDTSGFWATLGRRDDGPILDRWSGQIECSRNGNKVFSGVIADDINAIKEIYPGENLTDDSFTERYISLDDVSFSNVGGANELRLTVMVSATEHAIVAIQHTSKDDAASTSGVLQYLLPEMTEDLGKRDRQTYFFDVSPIPGELSTRFVIKIITFKRDVFQTSSPEGIQAYLARLDNPYGFTKYITTANNEKIFTPIEPADIDRTKKTLFLFHGTFATVAGSYGDLRDNGWMQAVLDKGRYQQIIGFDHYTMIASPQENAATFFEMLSPGGKFTQPADIITTSRGGLVGKCVLNNKEQQLIHFERAATVACANGVAYLDTADKISGFLSIMRRNPGVSSKIIFGVLQFGVDYFVAQKGLQAMKIDNPLLNDILEKTPANPQLRYYPICGDYSISNKEHKLEGKILDLLISSIIADPHHDWVVETDRQVIMPPAFYAYSTQGKNMSWYRNQPIDSIHTRYFDDGMTTVTKERISNYLHDDGDIL